MTNPESIQVCVLSSTSYGHVETGYSNGVWAVPRTTIGGLRHRADAIRGMPCLFYVSALPVWGEGFFCGPGIVTDAPSDDFADLHAELFPEGGDWCLGFPFERLALGVKMRMNADSIRQLQVVAHGSGNYSQDLHLAGRCVFLPCHFPVEDCRRILTATGATVDALDKWIAASARLSLARDKESPGSSPPGG